MGRFTGSVEEDYVDDDDDDVDDDDIDNDDDDDIDKEDQIMDYFLEMSLCVIPIYQAGFQWLNRKISISSFEWRIFYKKILKITVVMEFKSPHMDLKLLKKSPY